MWCCCIAAVAHATSLKPLLQAPLQLQNRVSDGSGLRLRHGCAAVCIACNVQLFFCFTAYVVGTGVGTVAATVVGAAVDALLSAGSLCVLRVHSRDAL